MMSGTTITNGIICIFLGGGNDSYEDRFFGDELATIGKAWDLNQTFELFEESCSDNQWPNLNQC
jgi:hypothetical protein